MAQPLFRCAVCGFLHKDHDGDGEYRPPDGHVEKGDPYGLAGVRQTKKGRLQCHEDIHGKQEAASKITE